MSMKSLQGRRTPGSRDECRTAPAGRRPLDQARGLEPLARLYQGGPKKVSLIIFAIFLSTASQFS